jgi:hypothetical protein
MTDKVGEATANTQSPVECSCFGCRIGIPHFHRMNVNDISMTIRKLHAKEEETHTMRGSYSGPPGGGCWLHRWYVPKSTGTLRVCLKCGQIRGWGQETDSESAPARTASAEVDVAMARERRWIANELRNLARLYRSPESGPSGYEVEGRVTVAAVELHQATPARAKDVLASAAVLARQLEGD